MKQKPEIRRITRSGLIRALTCIVNEETFYVAECREKGCPYAGTDCTASILPDVLYLLTKQERVKPAQRREE